MPQNAPSYLPYGKQVIHQDAIDAVMATLRSDWLTTGPMVEKFERRLGEETKQEHCVSFCNGTAALHAAMHAMGLKEGDEVIVPAITFVATANAALYNGAKPVFADVLEGSLLIDPADVERKITSRTRCIAAVDYAGQPCDYDALHAIAKKHNLHLLSDACHSLGGSYHKQAVGSLADITTFSFHPVKPITTGEGGAAVTDNSDFAERMRVFRGHGISGDFRQREKKATHTYEMTSLGYNFRLSDIHAALGIAQLKHLQEFRIKREALAKHYSFLLQEYKGAQALAIGADMQHGWHLYVVKVEGERDEIFSKMRTSRIGVNVHYLPVYLHPYYRDQLKYPAGLCQRAESIYKNILTLPLHVGMEKEDCERVIKTLKTIQSSNSYHEPT